MSFKERLKELKVALLALMFTHAKTCNNCKHLDRTKVLMSYPPKVCCNKGKYVALSVVDIYTCKDHTSV